MMITELTTWETTECSRCGGDGSYSWNSVDGSRCYGCQGTGQMLTKRGAAAKKFFTDSLRRHVSTLKVGDRLWQSGVSGFAKAGWHTIQSIKHTDANGGTWEITTTSGGVDLMDRVGDSIMWVQAHSGNLAELKAAALAYQVTLTKAGTPAKGV